MSSPRSALKTAPTARRTRWQPFRLWNANFDLPSFRWYIITLHWSRVVLKGDLNDPSSDVATARNHDRFACARGRVAPLRSLRRSHSGRSAPPLGINKMALNRVIVQRILAAALAIMGWASPALGQSRHADDRLRVVSLTGERTAALQMMPADNRIVLFWRSDCAPCLAELSYLSRLQEVSGDHVATVALEPATSARATLQRLGLSTHHAWAYEGDPMKVLTWASPRTPRLPLAIALKADRGICARRVGPVGTDHVAAWMSQCSR